jgi:alanine racemase
MRPTCLEVDLPALRRNLATARTLAQGAPLLAVVKGNAYGHGLVTVARTLSGAGADFLGVATVEEGTALRDARIGGPVLLLGGYLPEEAPDVVVARLTPTVFTDDQIDALAAAARAAGARLPVHVKVDTGMGRIGFAPEDAPAAVRRVLEHPELVVQGLFTHFAEADLADSPAAAEQLARLVKVKAELGPVGERIPCWHAANSAALLSGLMDAGPGKALRALYRPGIMLYGEPPASGFATGVELAPVATWKARVIQVKTVPAGTSVSYGRTFTTARESRIATLPVGYADGYRRSLSNRGRVLLQGHRVPVVGRVCMDMTMVDVTDLPGPVAAGDEAVLLGAQGNERITATEIADVCETIAYDILCGVSDRVPRRYAGSSP